MRERIKNDKALSRAMEDSMRDKEIKRLVEKNDDLDKELFDLKAGI